MPVQAARLIAAAAYVAAVCLPALAHDTRYDAAVARLARQHGVPERLVHRVIVRESRYNERAINHGHYGLMQIKLQTAQGMGYRGGASGLLNGETNLTYAVPYLANAYLCAGHNEDGAVRLYAGGYYYVCKRKGLLARLHTAHSRVGATGEAASPAHNAYAPHPPRRDAPF
ncbi:MAG: lytic transglycosylase domain-containing protein [Hyphomicrobiales bacterium]|nr:lytic transglycosylase domain-containing protein [Hyphomicrobiales bacterium]